MDEFINKLESVKKLFPHSSNLLHKIKKSIDGGNYASQEQAYLQIKDTYYHVVNNSLDTSKDLNDWVTDQVAFVNNYLNLLKAPSCSLFSHQSDFKSSVIPELVCAIFHQLNNREELELLAEGQNDVTIDLLFSHKSGGKVFPKKKRVDAALLLPYSIGTAGVVEGLSDFKIPIVTVEVKTNLDKNMIAGIQHSVERMKGTFPECKYYVLSEFSDFNINDQNYANSSVDEIFILRQQKRSEVRSGKAANDISKDLVLEFVSAVKNSIIALRDEHKDVSDRLSSGCLIH